MKPSPTCPSAWRMAIALLVLVFASTASAQNENANHPSPGPSPAAAGGGAAPADGAAKPAAGTNQQPQNDCKQTPASLDDFCVDGVSDSARLGDEIKVYLFGQQKVAELEKYGGPLSSLVLFLDGYPMNGVTARYGSYDNEIKFRLERTDNPGTRSAWDALLGGIKNKEARRVSVSVGYGTKPLRSNARTYLIAIREGIAWACLFGLAFLVGMLIFLARRSNLIRDIGPDPADQNGRRLYQDRRGRVVTSDVDASGNVTYKDVNGNLVLSSGVKPVLKTYSLSRTQLAFWVVIALASFFFIWLVTTDRQSLPTFVLGILGISSATAVGSALIDSSRRTGSESERAGLESHLAALQKEQQQLQGIAAPTQADTDRLSVVTRDIAETQAAIKRIDDFKPGPTQGFWRDILTDDTGITIHRFQIVAWTITLGIIFAVTVINTLTMPNYDGTLLALMGISSGTYISLKPTEKPTENPAGNPGS